jgi:hypothetical protein
MVGRWNMSYKREESLFLYPVTRTLEHDLCGGRQQQQPLLCLRDQELVLETTGRDREGERG